MSKMRILLLLTTLIPLSACGPEDTASPGEGVLVTPPPGAPVPPPPPPSSPAPPRDQPAASCPALTTDRGVVGNRRNCEISGTITGNRLVQDLPGVIYSLSGRVQVGQDAGSDPSNPLPGSQTGSLTIDPGVVIFGSGGLDFLVVNRGSQIFAEGTQTRPIVFTSRQNIEGTATDASIGQFGGIVILGRAPIQSCNQPNVPGGSVMRRLINSGGDESVIASHAFRNAPNLGSAARGLVREGVTTAEEAVRISRHEGDDA